MKVDRIRRVDNQREMEEIIDDYVTTGYKVISRGETTTKVRENGGWGSIGGHLITLLLTSWFTFGIGNLIYALVKHYSGEKVLVKVRKDTE